LLTLPALLSAWVEGVVRQREKVAGMERMLRNMAGDESGGEDPVLQRLRERRERFHHARHRLLEDTVFYLVLIPERLPIEETARSLQTLTENGIEVGALFVNRVLPESADEGEFMHARLAQQREYLAEIESRFTKREIVRVEQDPRDISGRDQLETIARSLQDGMGAG
jgi:arsenite-transporting ATPase